MQTTAREYFERIRQIRAEIEIMERRLQHYRETATGTGTAGSGVQTSVSSKVENVAVSCADLDAVIDQEVQQYRRLRKAAEQIISGIEKVQYRQLITMRYVENRAWQEISDALQYTDVKSVFRANRKALEAAQKLLDRM